jgi:hypothetical protein
LNQQAGLCDKQIGMLPLAVGTRPGFGRKEGRIMQVRTRLLLATTAFALLLASPIGALAQTNQGNDPASFSERYGTERNQPAAERNQPAAEQPGPRVAQYTPPRTRVGARRPRSRVVVTQRSFLDAGTEVQPGERKFLDYAFPPTHTYAWDGVTNTGGRVGWHNSPLPGPFFPSRN